MKKVLFVATVVKTHIMEFHIPYLQWFKENGYETHVCAKNDYDNKEECNIPFCDKYYDIPFARSPLSFRNLKSYRKLKRIIETNKYDIIHCHTPVGGALTRLAARKIRKSSATKVVYTAHGFHFFKGAPIKNWLIYYPIERYLAKYTDVLITINKEDYNRVRKKFRAERIEYVPGVGVRTSNFRNLNIDRDKKRKELGVKEDELLILSVGELNKNKNHKLIIKSLANIKEKNFTYIICGQGPLDEELAELAELFNVNLILLGYRHDITEICYASDLFVFPSLREGLSVALMEAMAAGLPVLCSRIRGNTDLIDNRKGGYLIGSNDIEEYSNMISRSIKYSDDIKKMGKYNQEKIYEFDIEKVKEKMEKIYLRL